MDLCSNGNLFELKFEECPQCYYTTKGTLTSGKHPIVVVSPLIDGLYGALHALLSKDTHQILFLTKQRSQ